MRSLYAFIQRALRAALIILLLGVVGLTKTIAQYVPHWTPATGYSENMSVLGPIILDGQILNSIVIEIGAFCNEECRGSAFIEDMGIGHMALQTINGQPGDVLSFKLYDHIQNEIVKAVCHTTIAFETNATIGYDTPFEIAFTSMLPEGFNFTEGDLIYSINEDLVSVTVIGHVDGQDATGSLTIPSQVTFEGNDYTVTAIGNEAFKNCTKLTGSLTIPNSVTSIGNNAF